MAERDDVGREQIEGLSRRIDRIEEETKRCRDKLHDHAGKLTAHGLLTTFIPDLVAFKNKAVGIVIGLSVVVSAVTAVVVKVIG